MLKSVVADSGKISALNLLLFFKNLYSFMNVVL